MAPPAARQPKRRKLAKTEKRASLSPVPEVVPKADHSASGAGKNGVDNEQCGNVGANAIIAAGKNCEDEERVTDAVAEDVVQPHQTNSVYGDVLSHLMSLPFEAKSMFKFHQTKESLKANGRRKRKPSRNNNITIYSQKQYLRGVGLMPGSKIDLAAVVETKHKRRVVESSPARAPVLHSNLAECIAFSPRSVKTLESPKRGDPQAQLKHDATTTDLLNLQLRDVTAFQEQAALAQMQQHQIFHNQQNIASLHDQHELQELQLLHQQFHQQQPSYYYPFHAVNHHLYHQMLAASYSFNPYQSFQQLGYQHMIPPQLLQSFWHDGVIPNNNDNDAVVVQNASNKNNATTTTTTTTTTTEAANQNAQTSVGSVQNPNNNYDAAAVIAAATITTAAAATTTTKTAKTKEAAKKITQPSFTGGLPPENHTTTADLLAMIKPAKGARKKRNDIATTAVPQQKLFKSIQDDVAALPPLRRNTDDPRSNIATNDAAAKCNVNGEDAASKMTPNKDAVKSIREVRISGREKRKQVANIKGTMNDSVKVIYSPEEKRKGQNGITDPVAKELPSGWTTLTHRRRHGEGTYKHYVSPNLTVFRSLKNARSFLAIQEELKDENGGKEPLESEALVIFRKRGHKL